MEKNDRSRARRRHATARMKRRAKEIYPHMTPGKAADHLAMCSCAGCGNPRRFYGEETISEKKQALRILDYSQEVSEKSVGL
jgi:hypothetical protein